MRAERIYFVFGVLISLLQLGAFGILRRMVRKPQEHSGPRTRTPSRPAARERSVSST